MFLTFDTLISNKKKRKRSRKENLYLLFSRSKHTHSKKGKEKDKRKRSIFFYAHIAKYVFFLSLAHLIVNGKRK